MNKKASMGVMVGIIIFVMIIGLIVTSLIIAKQKGYFIKKEIKPEPTLKLHFMARDLETLESIDSTYILDYTNNSKSIVLSKGNLSKDVWKEVDVPIKIIHVYSWSKDHYLVKASKEFIQSEIQKNKSNFYIDIPKIGKLNVKHTGDLKNNLNQIKLNITSDNWFKKTSLAFSWTAGIVNVWIDGGENIICEKGNWINYSYDATTKTYTYFENNYYKCDERLERCESVELNKCKPFNTLMPLRFQGTYDSVVYLGKTISPGESIEVILNVKTLGVNALDELKITIYDQDRRWNPNEQMFTYMSELNGVNIGSPDLTYVIK